MTIEKIKEKVNSWSRDLSGLQVIPWSDESAMNEVMVGHRVVAVDEDHLKLDDGTVVKVVPNKGGCACSAGDYFLDQINLVSNLITRVEVEDKPGGDGVPCRTCGKTWCYGEAGHESGSEGTYKIFVWSHDERLELASMSGSDGNGYYGTGFELVVRKVG